MGHGPLLASGVFCLCGGVLAAQDADEESPSAEALADLTEGLVEEDEGFPLHGYVSMRYRGRWGGNDADHDVYQVLALDFGDAKRFPVTGHVMTQLSWDVDGDTDADGEFAFFSLSDTYDSRLTGRLYHAYADFHDFAPLETLRIGRQLIYDTPEVAWFDGLRVESGASSRRRVKYGAYAGIPVHPYESSPEGDAVFGLYGEGRPWKGGRARLDWMHFDGENLNGDHDDDLFAGSVWQEVGKGTSVEASHTRLEGDPRDVKLAMRHFDLEGDLTLEVSYYELVRTQKDQSLQLDPFFSTLFEYFPFHQVGVLASKGIGDNVIVQGGADLRRVEDEDDVGAFNRDFERYFLITTFDDLPHDLSLALTGETWKSAGSDIDSWGVDVSRDFGEEMTASLGTYYSLFKYNYYLDEERDHVRTYFANVRLRKGGSASFDMRYEFEDNDFDEFHVLRLGATWRF